MMAKFGRYALQNIEYKELKVAVEQLKSRVEVFENRMPYYQKFTFNDSDVEQLKNDVDTMLQEMFAIMRNVENSVTTIVSVQRLER